MPAARRSRRVSVVLATYNGARYLREQLNSIEQQTVQPAQLVACDDGSTDDTLEILEQFKARAAFEVLTIANAMRLGSTENFLSGARSCAGDLIAFSDQDDVWHPKKLEIQSAEFDDPDVLLVSHSAEVVDAGLKSLGYRIPSFRRREILTRLQSPFAYHPGFTLLFSASLLREFGSANLPDSPVGPFRATMAHDDWVCFLASLQGKRVFLPEVLVRWRRHGQNATATLPASFSDAGMRKRLANGAQEYLDASRAYGVLARYTAEFATRTDEPLKSRLAEASTNFETRSTFMGRRAALYESEAPFARRIAILSNLLQHRGYQDGSRGGLGPKAFMKDLAFIAFRPALHWLSSLR